jgi:hypothetical protein
MMVRSSARERARREAARRAQRARKEAKLRAAEQAAIKRRRKERVNELGRAGVGLIEHAESAITRITLTEAAQTGWLGDLSDLDFSADLATITANVKQAQQLRNLADELKALPSPTAADRAMLDEAKAQTKRLEQRAKERAKLLADCASKAELIDKSLRDEREQARIAERRDDVRSRMSATLHGVDAMPDASQSDATDRVTAFVDAYQEIRAVIERARRAEGGEVEDPAARTWTEELLDPVTQAWKWLVS